MGIQRIGEYVNPFSNYKAGSQVELTKDQQDIQSIQKPQEAKDTRIIQDVENSQESYDTSVQKQEIVLPKAQVSRNADINNISLKFNASDDYSYIGKDKDITNLDMQKAISDMKKDSVLQEYQYFVGSSKNFLESKVSEDGVVIPKFDI